MGQAHCKHGKVNLDLVAVQEVRWVEGGNQPADDYTFFYEKRMLIITPGHAFSYTRVSYKQLRGYNLLATGCRI
jgi:hypothetical protein